MSASYQYLIRCLAIYHKDSNEVKQAAISYCRSTNIDPFWKTLIYREIDWLGNPEEPIFEEVPYIETWQLLIEYYTRKK